MESMRMMCEQLGSAQDVEHLNRQAMLELMEAGAGDLQTRWEDRAGDEFDDCVSYSPDEVGLGSWCGSNYDD